MGKLAALPTGNDTTLKDVISCKPVFVLRKQVFGVVAPCVWEIVSDVSKKPIVFIFRVMSP
jgi:hypothetical protein